MSPIANRTEHLRTERPAVEPPATGPGRSRLGRRWWIGGIVIVALVVVILAPLASSDPDGLNRVAEDAGFIGSAQNVIGGLLSGYDLPFVSDPNVSKVLSGLLGVGIVLLLMFVLGRVLARRRG
jgi:hypothetical protein